MWDKDISEVHIAAICQYRYEVPAHSKSSLQSTAPSDTPTTVHIELSTMCMRWYGKFNKMQGLFGTQCEDKSMYS